MSDGDGIWSMGIPDNPHQNHDWAVGGASCSKSSWEVSVDNVSMRAGKKQLLDAHVSLQNSVKLWIDEQTGCGIPSIGNMLGTAPCRLYGQECEFTTSSPPFGVYSSSLSKLTGGHLVTVWLWTRDAKKEWYVKWCQIKALLHFIPHLKGWRYIYFGRIYIQ